MITPEDLKCSEEVALDEFERFAESNDLEFNESEMEQDDLSAFKKQRRRFTRAIQRGALVIDADGAPVYTPQNERSKCKEPLRFRQRSGASLMASDSRKPNQLGAKMYAIMADMCGVDAKVFAGLVGEDVKVCEAIFVFLMD